MGHKLFTATAPQYGPTNNNAGKKLEAVFKNRPVSWQVQEATSIVDGLLYSTLSVRDDKGVHTITELTSVFPSDELIAKAMLLWG